MKRATLTADEFRAQQAKPRRRHKYNAKRTTVDGITFDSKREAERWCELRTMERAGLIDKLELQPEYVLQKSFDLPNGKRVRAIKYRADFRYVEQRDGAWHEVVEDVKGRETPVWRLKQKLFWVRYRDTELRVTK